MSISQGDGKMEGWLYLIRSNRFGLQYSRKRYFILEDSCLRSFKSKPTSDKEFGASSPEEAARWIRSLQDAALHPAKNFKACSKRKWQPFRLSISKRTAHKKTVDWTSVSCMHMDAMTSDVIAPSPWKIFGCQNGLRLFKEAKDRDSRGTHWDDNPAIMAVGVVDGTSEAVFHTVMSLGASRSEKCPPQDSYVRARFKSNVCFKFENYEFLFAPICDASYLHLPYASRGGFVISPVNQGKESVVKHMLAINWKLWRSYLRKASARSVTVRMLERVAALRELFRAKAGNYYSSEFSSVEMTKDIGLSQSEKEDVKTEVQNSDELIKIEGDKMEAETGNALSGNSSLRGLNDASDEFFDVPEHSDDDQLENDWPSDLSPELHYPDTYQPRMSTAAGFVRKLHDLAVQKKVGYMDLQEVAWEENVSCCYGATLAKDPGCNLPCSWTTADPSTFLIRGESYLQDRQKIKAKSTLMQMVAADWIRSDKREDDLGSRPGGIVQKYAANDGPEFFLIVNMQIPGFNYVWAGTIFHDENSFERNPYAEELCQWRRCLQKFKGSWIVKQSVGKKACLVGQALEVKYNRGKNYLELGIDVGSSTVARGVASLVLGYLNNLVIEMAFLIQANTQEELPECLIGTCRLNHLDVSKTVVVKPETTLTCSIS
ncbi:pleckstrin homology (PH) and lipid-binding START domains-containing protein [Actinidia rufa]|uniref:Pleckstrin homology (PH) and lipid-binding START domains-containing protein n=1 Tax=Actinidia rufa TaxID=165716 RepID=A0A7J0GV88_9ERIC|nr:pleckstrin homology (PH) and lipid-binding START domains-containing protein [Actinidia rufa]